MQDEHKLENDTTRRRQGQRHAAASRAVHEGAHPRWAREELAGTLGLEDGRRVVRRGRMAAVGRWQLAAEMRRSAGRRDKREWKCIDRRATFARRPMHFCDGVPFERKNLCICAMTCQRVAPTRAFLTLHASGLLADRLFSLYGGGGSQKLKCPPRRGARQPPSPASGKRSRVDVRHLPAALSSRPCVPSRTRPFRPRMKTECERTLAKLAMQTTFRAKNDACAPSSPAAPRCRGSA